MSIDQALIKIIIFDRSSQHATMAQMGLRDHSLDL
jgi:hypothetical protein